MTKRVVIFCFEARAFLIPAVSAEVANLQRFLAAVSARLDGKRGRFSPALSPAFLPEKASHTWIYAVRKPVGELINARSTPVPADEVLSGSPPAFP